MNFITCTTSSISSSPVWVIGPRSFFTQSLEIDWFRAYGRHLCVPACVSAGSGTGSTTLNVLSVSEKMVEL